MAVRGRPCTICNHPKRSEIESGSIFVNRRAGTAKKYAVSEGAISNHRAHHMGRGQTLAPVMALVPLPPAPVIPPGATQEERAKAHVEYLAARLKSAETAQDGRAVAAIAAQYTSAMRFHAKVSGALDLTEAQLVRSAPFSRVLAVVRGALEKYPTALKAVVAALDTLQGGK